MKIKLAVAVLAMAVLAVGAHAWPSCSGNWIQVPAGTSTANGAVVTENGQTFQCQKPTPTPTPTPTTNSNTNSNANNNANANNNTNNNSNSASSAANSASNSASSSSSNQTQKQGQTQTASGGAATATGGAVNLSNSGNSSSTSTNTNSNAAQGGGGGQGGAGGVASATAKGGAGGAANATAGNSSSGSGNSTSISESYISNTPRQTATAIAPDTVPTSPCFKPFSGAAQGPAFGFSFGAGKIDIGCDDRETARLFGVAGNREAFAIIMCNTPSAKRSHLTLEQCKDFVPTPTPVIVPETKVVPPTTIYVPAPQVVIQTPAPQPLPVATNDGILHDIGTCKFVNARPTNVCYRLMDDAVIVLNNSPSARLIMTGSLQATKILPYVDGKIARSRIELRLSDDQYSSLTIATWSVQ